MQSDAMAPSQKYDFYSHGIASGHQDIFTPFLGPPSREAKTTPYAKKATAKWNMPEAYIGENEFLGDTMEDLMLTAQWDWYTERILPWYKTDNIHMQWTEWENNPHYMGITPHQATSRVVTQRRTIRKASIVRRGIAYEFENDFVSTALGRASFMASLAQMARSVQETANVEVLRALLHCHRYQQLYVRKHGIVADGDLDGWLDRKAERFMIAQKETYGLEILNTQIDAEQELYQAKADTWILGREVMDYCSLVPEGKVFYWLGGQEAIDRVNGRPQNGNASAGTMGNVKSLQPQRMIADTPVYLAKSYHVDSIGKAELLSRVTEVGVYNLMVDRCRDYTRYRTDSRQIRVYDNDIDAWSDIGLVDAIRHCGIWKDNGQLEDYRTLVGRGKAREVNTDDDYDFLSKKDVDGKRTDIAYVGDMAVPFLPSEVLINAARTVLAAASQHDPAKIQANLTAPSDAFYETVDDLLCLNRSVAAEREGGEGGVILESSIQNQQRIGAFLTKYLGAAVPATHAKHLEKIVNQENVAWTDRAESIKQLVLKCQKEDPSSVPSLPNAEHVHKWYEGQVSGFKQKLEASASAEPAKKTEKIGSPSFSVLDYLMSTTAGKQSSPANSASLRRARIGATVSAPGARTDDLDFKKAIQTGYKTILEREREINGMKSVNEVLREIAKKFLLVPFNRDCLVKLAENNILVPLGFLLMRPHATYKTRYGIKMAANGKSGYTMFGHSNMMIEHEAARKVGMMHYTAYLSAVVMHPKNVYVVEDLFCEKYLGGMGVEFWNAVQYKNAAKRHARSIICAPLPPTWKKIEQKIDVRGRWYTEQRMGLVAQDRFEKPLYPGAARMNAIFGWYDSSRKDGSSNRTRHPPNYVCWQGNSPIPFFLRQMHNDFLLGHTWYFNSITGRFDDYTVEAGNFGSKVYPGCGLVRNGAMKYLKDPNYQNVHVH